jgi:hypothetical protein
LKGKSKKTQGPFPEKRGIFLGPSRRKKSEKSYKKLQKVIKRVVYINFEGL